MGERRQYLAGLLPPKVVEHLERLVGEVDRVASIEEEVVGRGHPHERRHAVGFLALGRGRRQYPLSCVPVARLDEPSVPGQEPVSGHSRLQGGQWEPGRPAARVSGHERQPVHKGERPVFGFEVRQHIGHGREHGEASAPPRVTVTDAEGHAGPDGGQSGRLRAQRFAQPEDRLRNYQRQTLFQPLFQPAQVVTGPVSFGAHDDHDLAIFDLYIVGSDIVSERVQCAARHEVETGMVPMAGEEPVFHGATVEREPHVGTTVIDGIGLAVAQENAHRRRADLAGQVPLRFQFIEGADPLPLPWTGGLRVGGLRVGGLRAGGPRAGSSRGRGFCLSGVSQRVPPPTGAVPVITAPR